MVQQIIILLIFAGALFYLGRLVYKTFTTEECASGCGKCSVANFKRTEKQLTNKQIG